MYAVIESGNKQERVTEGQQIHVDLLQAEQGSDVSLTPVLLVDGDTVLATPDQLKGASVTARVVGLARLPALWLRHWQPHSIGVAQERAAYSGLKGWGRTRFLIRNRRLLYAPTPPNGCVLRRTPILAWALLDTLERHPSLPDVSVLFNWCADARMHQYPITTISSSLFSDNLLVLEMAWQSR
jgi:ribosomal protein L21